MFSLFGYYWNHGSWLLFVLLFLVPDVSMVGYRIGVRAGKSVLCAAPYLKDYSFEN